MTSAPLSEKERRDLIRLRKVRDRIDREHALPLNVEELARSVHMSAGHLSRQFKAAYGESPYGYLMTRRIERAMALLRRGDMSVTDVCFEVGCSSLGTFSTRFTQLVGVSPSTYREDPARATDGIPACLAKQVTRPVRGQLGTGQPGRSQPTKSEAAGSEAAKSEPVRNQEAQQAAVSLQSAT